MFIIVYWKKVKKASSHPLKSPVQAGLFTKLCFLGGIGSHSVFARVAQPNGKQRANAQ